MTKQTAYPNVIVTLRGDELLRATLSGSIYHVNCTLLHPTCNTHSDAASSGSWHKYLGHKHPNAIRQAEKHQKMKGLTFASDRTHEVCALTVPHNPPFADTTQRHYERMDLLVVHLSGPMATPTWTGKTRVLIAVEINSGLSIGELLATKNDAAEVLKTIIRRLEHESGQKLKGICTDSSNMRLHEVVKDTRKRNGIQYDLHPESERNGAATHATAAYMQKVKSMLHTAGMDTLY
jgi:hypothetical protein